MKRIKWFKQVNELHEIYQVRNIQFSFAKIENGSFIQCHEWLKCRDFLHDAVRTTLTGKPSNIYGFRFAKYTNPDIDLNNTLLLVRDGSGKSISYMQNMLDIALILINSVEKYLNKDLSTLTHLNNAEDKESENVWLFSGPKFWISAPYLISLYTFLIRLGTYNPTINKSAKITKNLKLICDQLPQDTHDIKYINKIINNIEFVLSKNVYITKPNLAGFSEIYFENNSIESFHNNTGIVSTCNAITPSQQLNMRVKDVLNNL